MFAVYDAVRLAELESRSARPEAAVRSERSSRIGMWNSRTRLAMSGGLHRLADALAPRGEVWEPRLHSEC